MRNYIRDGRAPTPKNEVTSKLMSSNKATNNKLEKTFGSYLYRNKVRGYRKNVKGLPGRPDFCFTKYKLVVFIHGCFWHRCPKCNLALPKSNTEFWNEKFSTNRERDEMKIRKLRELGWEVIVFWECEVRENPNEVVESIKNELDRRRSI